MSRFRQFTSRLSAALSLATLGEKLAISEKLDAALAAGAATKTIDKVAAEVPPLSTGPVKRTKQRSIRKGTQSRFHAKRGAGHNAHFNHEVAHSKALNFIENALLQKLLFKEGHMAVGVPQQVNLNDYALKEAA